MPGELNEEVRLAARAWAPDDYLAALLAPEYVRADLVAIAAFLGDVERILATVSEPALAEIRLQWWRDAIAGAARDERTGHPVADAIGEAIRRHSLPVAEFEGLIEARTHDLYADPLAGEAALEAYLDMADGAAFRLSARCRGADPSTALIAAAGQAYGRARLCRTLAQFVARGRNPFPGEAGEAGTIIAVQLRAARESLASARALWAKSARDARGACLPLVLVGPYLKAASRPGHDPARMVGDITPLTRVWCLWRAHVTGRL